MKTTVPQLKIYYIDFDAEKSEENEIIGKNISPINPNQIVNAIYTGIRKFPMSPAAKAGIVIGPAVTYLLAIGAINLKRLYDEKRFIVITNEEELSKFKNAYNNEWVVDDKALRKRQYYIQHPKSSKSNLLIEAQSFYDYIEEEVKQELLDYVQSHCPARNLSFTRTEEFDVEAGAGGKIKQLKADVNAKNGKQKEDVISFKGAKGIIKPSTIDEYVWLEDSIKLGIRALEDGSGTFEKSFLSDYTFGLTAKEAKTLGLNMDSYKKFKYSVKVEC